MTKGESWRQKENEDRAGDKQKMRKKWRQTENKKKMETDQ